MDLIRTMRLSSHSIYSSPVPVHPEQAAPVVDVRVQLLQELGRRQLLAVLLVLADHRHLHRVTM